MTEKKSQLVTNPPDYIKQWYKDTAESKGLKMQSFAAMVLCEYAIANGAKRPEINEDKAVTENDVLETRPLNAYEQLQRDLGEC